MLKILQHLKEQKKVHLAFKIKISQSDLMHFSSLITYKTLIQ